MDTPTNEQRLQRIIQFHHPERMWPPLTDEEHARFLATDLQTYRRIRTQLADAIWQAAQDLLADADFATQVDRLPFAPGSTVLGLGDDLTEDIHSWFELLKAVVSMRRPQDEINFVNEGVSGNCTADVIRRITPLMGQRPEWVLCLLGSNDAGLFGHMPVKTLIVPNETARNLVAIRRAALVEAEASGVGCHWLWITPPPCVEALVRNDWFFSSIPLFYVNRDLAAVSDIVRRQMDPVADLWPSFVPDRVTLPIRPLVSLFLPDGLHPTLEAQKTILRVIVARLTQPPLE